LVGTQGMRQPVFTPNIPCDVKVTGNNVDNLQKPKASFDIDDYQITFNKEPLCAMKNNETNSQKT
jgi:hypothetical protein